MFESSLLEMIKVDEIKQLLNSGNELISKAYERFAGSIPINVLMPETES